MDAHAIPLLKLYETVNKAYVAYFSPSWTAIQPDGARRAANSPTCPQRRRK